MEVWTRKAGYVYKRQEKNIRVNWVSTDIKNKRKKKLSGDKKRRGADFRVREKVSVFLSIFCTKGERLGLSNIPVCKHLSFVIIKFYQLSFGVLEFQFELPIFSN